MYSNELQEKIISLMDDPSKVVIASIEKRAATDKHDYERFPLSDYLKGMPSTKVFTKEKAFDHNFEIDFGEFLGDFAKKVKDISKDENWHI